jgi:hypothetical protein
LLIVLEPARATIALDYQNYCCYDLLRINGKGIRKFQIE